MFRGARLLVPIAAGVSATTSSGYLTTSCENTRSVPLTNKQEDFGNVVILAGSASKSIASDICANLGTKVGLIETGKFSDGEVYPKINESIRGKHVFVVQTCSAPVNANIMELLLTITAARRADPASVTAVIPYFPYRHHRRGLPVSTTYHSKFLWSAAGDIAKMLLAVGVDNVISVDLQRPGQGHEACFFDSRIPVETISANDSFVNYFKTEGLLQNPVVVVSANTECVKKAQKLQKKLRANTNLTVDYAAFLHDQNVLGSKTSTYDSAANSELLGDVRGHDVVIVDELVDSGGSLSILCRRLLKEGARRVFVCASHGIFSAQSMDLIDLSPVEKVIVTDSIPLPAKCSKKIVQVPVGDLLARVIEAEVYGSAGRAEDEEIYEIE